MAELVVGAVVVVGEVVGLEVGELDDVGVALVVGDDVGVGLEVGEEVALLVAVADGWVTGVFPAGWGAGVAVGFFAAAFEELAVAVGVDGGFVASPASDAVELTLGVPCEWDVSRIATTAMIAAAATAVTGQRHRRQPDGRRAGGRPPVPPVPPGTSRPDASNGPDTGTRDVSGSSGPRACSTRVAATGSAAADAGTTGSSVVGS